TVDNLDYLESSSIEGMYTLMANFVYGTNADIAYQDALAAMARAARQLPSDMDPPLVIKADPSQLPVVQLAVTSSQWDQVRLRSWVEDWLQNQLLAVSGVAGTEIAGGLKREIRVHLDQEALEKYQLSLTDVLRRLKEENTELFGGRVTVGRKEIITRTIGEFRSIDEIRDVVLLSSGQSVIKIRDIAQVTDSHEEKRVVARFNAQECVLLSVFKQADSNTVAVADAVLERIRELTRTLPSGVTLRMIESQADYVNAALSGVKSSAFQAALMVIAVVWLFLGSWRQVLVVLIALVSTLILNFGLMHTGGFSLNIFSLGGLVIAIGILVDNSLVVIESVSRRLKESPDIPVGESSEAAANDIGSALLAATLSFLALFLPFLLIPGMISLLFRELILVIAGIVVISLFTALTLTPMLAATLLDRSGAMKRTGYFENQFLRITEAYGRILESVIRVRLIVVIGFVLLLVLAVSLARGLGSEFLPETDDGRIMIKVKLPTGASLAETTRVLEEVERAISGDVRIESYYTLAGGKVMGLAVYEIASEGELNIQLIPRAKRDFSTSAFIESLKPVIGRILVPGGNVMVSKAKLKGIRKLGEADIELKIKGSDTVVLFDLARRTSAAMNELAHFKNVYVSLDMNKPEYQVRVDRVKAAELGISLSEISGAVRTLIGGAVATRYRDGDEYYSIRVMIPESAFKGMPDVANLTLRTSSGGFIKLADVAEVVEKTGPVEIVREDQVSMVIVRGDADGVTVGQALAELKSGMDRQDIPAGYEISYGGQAQMMAEMVRVARSVLTFAVFFSFIVLAVQFNSLKLPALILGNVPFCMIGMVFIMSWIQFPIGATVLIGVLVVVAATVSDGVLVFTYAEELQKRQGIPPARAVVDAAKIRLRPRLMTTLTTLIGLMPLALNIGEGGDMLQPMAVGAVGGLAMEILVTLFLMPCLYVMTGKRD
ncbi:MAG: efflux RND transporter permease subunit, partial [Candidatus Wallbacteria bacterium]|nr:efflux RND transporter permease subunit [Candidatus Wallbacteria bacterium]